MLNLNKLILTSIISLLLFSCTEDRVYEQNIDFEKNIWTIDNSTNFQFEIEDSDKMYQLFFNIRYDADYPNRNLYITYDLKDSTESSIDKALVNFKLFSDKLGKPLGKSSSNVISLQSLMIDSLRFPFEGTYNISLQQYMRKDSLPGLYSAGIKILEFKSAAE